MTDVTFLMLAIAFVLVAFLSSVATLNAPPTVRRIASWVICGSCVAALSLVPLWAARAMRDAAVACRFQGECSSHAPDPQF
jgi:hypothetical protein